MARKPSAPDRSHAVGRTSVKQVTLPENYQWYEEVVPRRLLRCVFRNEADERAGGKQGECAAVHLEDFRALPLAQLLVRAFARRADHLAQFALRDADGLL